MEAAGGEDDAAQNVLGAEKKVATVCSYCNVGTRTALGNLRSCPGFQFVKDAIPSLDMMCRMNTDELTETEDLVFKSVTELHDYRKEAKEKKKSCRSFHAPCGPFKLPASAANDNNYLDRDNKGCVRCGHVLLSFMESFLGG